MSREDYEHYRRLIRDHPVISIPASVVEEMLSAQKRYCNETQGACYLLGAEPE